MNNPNTQSGNPRELEERANEQRSEINRTLSQIEEHFSPSQMIEQAMGLFKGNGGEMANNLGRTVRDNPVPMILTGVGLAWMAMSQNSSRSRGPDRGYDDYYAHYRSGYGRYPGDGYRDHDVRDFRDNGAYRTASDSFRPEENISGGQSSYSGDRMSADSSKGQYSDQDEQSLIDKAKDAGSDALDSLTDAKDQAEYRYREEAARARHAARDWRDRADGQMQDFHGSMRSTAEDASRFMREQPLVVGAAGIALGALIGALLPPTRIEDRLAGQRSDAITDDVEQVSGEKLTQGASVARENLQKTAEDVRETASDALNKADKKADSATNETASTA